MAIPNIIKQVSSCSWHEKCSCVYISHTKLILSNGDLIIVEKFRFAILCNAVEKEYMHNIHLKNFLLFYGVI